IADHTTAEQLLRRGLSRLPHSDPRRVALLNWCAFACIDQRSAHKFTQATGLTQEALDLAKQLDDQSGIANSFYYLGRIAFETGGDEQDQAHVQRSLTLFRAIDEQQKISDCLSLLGEIAHHNGHMEEAITYSQESLSIVERIGAPYSVGYVLDQLGQAYIVQGKYEQAIHYFQRSCDVLLSAGYEHRAAWTLLNSAHAPMLQGDYEQANSYLNQSIAIAQKYGVQMAIGFCLNNLGRVATLTGAYEAGQNYLSESNDIFYAIGNNRSRGYNWLQLGLISCLQEKFTEAGQYFKKSLNRFQELDDQRFIAYSQSRLGITYIYTKPAEAERTLHKALTLAQSLDIEPCILEILFGYSLLFIQQGKPIQAGELAGLAQYHPSSNKEIQLWLKIIRPQLTTALSTDDLARAIEKGNSLDLPIVVQALLTDGELISAETSPSKDGEASIGDVDNLIINGRYHLQEALGQGGMGIVHRATDRLTGDIVALKQIKIPAEQLQFMTRVDTETKQNLRLSLAREFQILAGLRHPHIISVLDYGFNSNRMPYFTMTYLPSAQTFLEAGIGLDIEAKIDLFRQLLQALAYLHRRGVIHRDIKPRNVLVTKNHVRVLDFGLSFEQKTGLTSAGGTLLYMAPEILTGNPASFASDLYAVGVMAYELFAGHHPFDVNSAQFAQQLQNEGADLSLLNLDETLTEVIGQLLAKKPRVCS
ncbi:MAG: tetratricopeptide repeat protein, partial [Chloroflexota bacterium]